MPPNTPPEIANILNFLAQPAEPRLIAVLFAVGVAAVVLTCVGLVLFGKH